MNMNLMPDEDEKQLLRLKDGMSEQQRNDMAEIIQNELKRRENLSKRSSQASLASRKSAVKPSRLSGQISHEDLADIYQNSDKDIQKLRVESLEKKLEEAKREVLRLGSAGKALSRKRKNKTSSFKPFTSVAGAGNMPGIILVVMLLTFGILRYTRDGSPLESYLSFGKAASNPAARASLGNTASRADGKENIFIGDQAVDAEQDNIAMSSFTPSEAASPVERGLLLQLDQRRVELEKRRVILDNKERELQQQAQLVSEKVTELKTLINKLSGLRKEKDHKYNARMEQLASVYSAMAPNESASLIGKLDNDVGLALLERMPGKRMAQILGVMDQNRALELTKHLTDKKKL